MHYPEIGSSKHKNSRIWASTLRQRFFC